MTVPDTPFPDQWDRDAVHADIAGLPTDWREELAKAWKAAGLPRSENATLDEFEAIQSLVLSYKLPQAMQVEQRSARVAKALADVGVKTAAHARAYLSEYFGRTITALTDLSNVDEGRIQYHCLSEFCRLRAIEDAEDEAAFAALEVEAATQETATSQSAGELRKTA